MPANQTGPAQGTYIWWSSNTTCSEHWPAPSWYLSVVKPPWIMRCMQTMLRRKKRMHRHRNVKGNLPILMRMISGSITSWPANNAQWFIVYYHSRHHPNNSIAIHFIKMFWRYTLHRSCLPKMLRQLISTLRISGIPWRVPHSSGHTINYPYHPINNQQQKYILSMAANLGVFLLQQSNGLIRQSTCLQSNGLMDTLQLFQYEDTIWYNRRETDQHWWPIYKLASYEEIIGMILLWYHLE